MKHFVPLSRSEQEEKDNIKKHLKHTRENEKFTFRYDAEIALSKRVRQEEKCALKGKRKEFKNSKRFYRVDSR
jgi:hypothetical protein